ncbi:response regulator [Bordetella genomosp. 9]|uniref:histidine kinase n=1 Tax=Bordetella genomosp. 9 TaxID=1416803 RepID=A0A1W6Z450_9BORD|nr:response regulator [Bordetella genomosp. 9]ARP88150.1 hybrid sensor histidine kinase/response regulator [Bordetella genomosp. 9]
METALFQKNHNDESGDQVNDAAHVLILTPHGRDAEVIRDVVDAIGARSTGCDDARCLLSELESGASCAVLPAASLTPGVLDSLAGWVVRQEPWSDFPFLVVESSESPLAGSASERFKRLGNVMLLEQPLHADTLRLAIATALRTRERQYRARAQLQRQAETEEALRVLNETLETRISERTHALARANDRLMKEIRERERTQSALVQSQKMEAIGQLTGGLAHDFNNLLNVIMGSVELIQRTSPDERARRLAANAKQAVERGAKLTAQLLAFSRSQNLDLRPTDVNELLAGMRELLGLSLGPTVRVLTEFAPDVPKAIADANQLELAVLNLCLNARDAMPSGGVVTLSTAVRQTPEGDLPAGRYIVIAVKDTGSGIAPETLSKVFDPFFTTKPVGKGTGLGLSQVYGIARQSGGTARIASEQGRGTVVEIWLTPADPAALDNEPPALAEDKGGAAPANVLVIDDDPSVRNLIVECLQILGYEVRQAADGEAGLKLLQEQPPDLLMVDFIMPKLNGAEVIERARSLVPDLPVILATGYADAQVSGTILEHERVLQKPFNLDQLAAMVAEALQR